MTTTAQTAGAVISLNKSSTKPAWTGYYSMDGGTWQTYTFNTNITLANVGDNVYFKGTQAGDFSGVKYMKFIMPSGQIAASGSVMSLVCGDNYTTATALPYAGSCINLFRSCTNLITTPLLPATTITTNCYRWMFADCGNLTMVPALPATTLAENCYNQMFMNCNNLIVSDSSGTGYSNAWRIPTSDTFTGTTYAQTGMFENCNVGSGRASDDMPGTVGSSFTYYTQNKPII